MQNVAKILYFCQRFEKVLLISKNFSKLQNLVNIRKISLKFRKFTSFRKMLPKIPIFLPKIRKLALYFKNSSKIDISSKISQNSKNFAKNSKISSLFQKFFEN